MLFQIDIKNEIGELVLRDIIHFDSITELTELCHGIMDANELAIEGEGDCVTEISSNFGTHITYNFLDIGEAAVFKDGLYDYLIAQQTG